MHGGIAYLRWRGKRSRHSRRMRIRNFAYLARGPCSNGIQSSLFLTQPLFSQNTPIRHSIAHGIVMECPREFFFFFFFWVSFVGSWSDLDPAYVTVTLYIALVQEKHNPSALAMELRLSCINPLISCYNIVHYKCNISLWNWFNTMQTVLWKGSTVLVTG